MIIAICGAAKSGKDETAKIIKYCVRKAKNSKTDDVKFTEEEFSTFTDYDINFVNKKFAEKIKKLVAILLGCSEKKLEDALFKETALSSQWDKYLVTKEDGIGYLHTRKEVTDLKKSRRPLSYKKIQMTPRYLMETIGTEMGRNIIHPDLWVISLFTDYLPLKNQKHVSSQTFYHSNYHVQCHTCGIGFLSTSKTCSICESCEKTQVEVYPDWVISDLRFKNEAREVKKRKGLIIKIIRDNTGISSVHQSNLEWKEIEEDYLIENNGSIQDLIDRVARILKREKII